MAGTPTGMPQYECSLSGGVADAALPALVERLAALCAIQRDVWEHEIICCTAAGMRARPSWARDRDGRGREGRGREGHGREGCGERGEESERGARKRAASDRTNPPCSAAKRQNRPCRTPFLSSADADHALQP